MKKILSLVVLLSVLFSLNAFSQEKKIKVKISTEYGDMVVVLYNETPQHRDNFVKLVKEGWYENSPFHRIINNFMIQGGQNADGRLDPGYTVPAEFVDGVYHKKGALAAARKGDQVNPEKASSGSQFYIVDGKPASVEQLNMMSSRTGIRYTQEQINVYGSIGGTPHLDGAYTVFGEVIQGFEVIDKIAAVKTEKGDKPIKEVKMSMQVL